MYVAIYRFSKSIREDLWKVWFTWQGQTLLNGLKPLQTDGKYSILSICVNDGKQIVVIYLSYPLQMRKRTLW